jgi:hypothetical protein
VDTLLFGHLLRLELVTGTSYAVSPGLCGESSGATGVDGVTFQCEITDVGWAVHGIKQVRIVARQVEIGGENVEKTGKNKTNEEAGLVIRS